MTSKEQNIEKLEKALSIAFKKQEEPGLPENWQKGVMDKLTGDSSSSSSHTSTEIPTTSRTPYIGAFIGFFLFALLMLIFLWNFTAIDQFALMKFLLF